jgi:hypothetical protein
VTESPPDAEPRLVRCRHCHRPLREPEARALGVGPECAEAEFAARQGGIEQETLPGL